MTEIVINACYGGFGLSDLAEKMYREAKDICGEKLDDDFYISEIERDDPILVKIVKELGSEAASGMCAKLVVCTVEKGEYYRISEYDGYENIQLKSQDTGWILAT